ncbi:MAG: PAS domain S-box protein [Ignavibacteriales bacterium]|jgi:PAS domain S-box-containing protein|nr:PAS domain S-box protein [Ignavibacteriales bacterium]MBK7267925.1 PAS domain S-box protein [Ignavibacteriales bacterium]MBP7542283.1 PAS domain S-box protein [Ignavibacteriaceae bacterium]MBP9122746.1 PAS domain S-box protein [Ignavibacteriaceae bacterium]MCC6636614.1 PAS domain S-box protein [Ignavibacteriaceae bacterium]
MSDEKLSLKLLEVYPAPTVIHDYNSFVYVNNAAVKKFRATSKSDLIGKPILDFVHPSSLQETIKSLNSPERNDTFEIHDLHLLAQDGTSFYSDIVGTTITMDGKEYVHLLINDITQLRNSEQRYRSLYELAPEAILLEDEDGFILDANPAFFNLLGYSREETIGKHVRFLTLDKDPGIISNDIQKVISGEVLIQESYGKCKNGRVINVQLTESAFPLENNRMGLISIMTDITSRKKAEEEIYRLNRLYTVLSQTNKALVNTKSVDSLLQRICDILIKAGGFKLAWIGEINETERTLRPRIIAGDKRAYAENIVIHLDDEPATMGPTATAIKENRPYICNDFFNDPKTSLWRDLAHGAGFRASASFPFYFRKKVIGALNIYSDKEHVFKKKDVELLNEVAMNITSGIDHIDDETEREKAEAEVMALNSTLETRVIERTEELNAANKELEAFAYTVSHDLRAPLRAIDGFSKILMEDYYDTLDDQGRVVCKVISDNAETMGQLIDELLQFSRLSRSELHFLPVDLNPIISSLYEMLTTPEQREKIKFTCPILPVVKADPLMIKQVWQNLLSNAIKFSRKVEEPTVKIDFYEKNDSFVFTVEDNGAGFNMKYAAKLFGVFQRLHTIKEFEGTGVGLAIVQRIVHRHGGKVWAESELNAGAKFYFTLKKAETGK